ncbi:MAG: transporter substrate-binding domain-containing protein, partial [Bryobacteraceae bacterium]
MTRTTERNFRFRPAASAVLALGLFVLCLIAYAVFSSRVDRTRTYRIGVDNLHPYQFIGPDGLPDGFAVEALSQAARRCGIRLLWIAAPQGPDAALRNGTVDLWPRLRNAPQRNGVLHITAPWIRQSFCLLSRDFGASGKAPTRPLRVSRQPSAFIGSWVKRFVPGAVSFPKPDAMEAARAVCRGETDAAFLEARMAESLVLKRPPGCGEIPLKIVPIIGADILNGVGATRAAAPVADTLRE